MGMRHVIRSRYWLLLGHDLNERPLRKAEDQAKIEQETSSRNHAKPTSSMPQTQRTPIKSWSIRSGRSGASETA